jgi:hypothetical protein
MTIAIIFLYNFVYFYLIDPPILSKQAGGRCRKTSLLIAETLILSLKNLILKRSKALI